MEAKGFPAGIASPHEDQWLSNGATILQQFLIWTGGQHTWAPIPNAKRVGGGCQPKMLTNGLFIRAVNPYEGQWGPYMSCHPVCGPTGSSQGLPAFISADELPTWVALPYREPAGNGLRSQ